MRIAPSPLATRPALRAAGASSRGGWFVVTMASAVLVGCGVVRIASDPATSARPLALAAAGAALMAIIGIAMVIRAVRRRRAFFARNRDRGAAAPTGVQQTYTW